MKENLLLFLKDYLFQATESLHQIFIEPLLCGKYGYNWRASCAQNMPGPLQRRK